MDDLVSAMKHWRRYCYDFQRAAWPDKDCVPDKWQAGVLWEFRGDVRPWKARVAMQSCAEAGKSCVLAWIGIWAVTCLGEPGHPVRIICASMSGTNLEGGLWRELGLWIKRSPMLNALLEVKATRIVNRANPDSYIEARTWPTRANPEQIGDSLSGIHGRWQGYLIDESGSVPPIVLKRCEQGMGSPDGWAFTATAGNPAELDSMLYAASKRSDYKMVRITADPDDPERTPRVSVEHARKAIKEAELGRDDPWVRVYILGMFPETGFDRLLSPESVERAMDRELDEMSYAEFARTMGVDVGTNGDPSVLFKRQGMKVWAPYVWRGLDGLQGAVKVNEVWTEWEADGCLVDDTGGWGSAWRTQLSVLGRETLPVIYNARADEPDEFVNKRSEIIWRVREGVLNGGWQLPKGCHELLRDLTEVKYTIVKDKVAIEPKERLRLAGRLGRSSDWLDALANTTAFEVQSRRKLYVGYGVDGMYPVDRAIRASDSWANDWS